MAQRANQIKKGNSVCAVRDAQRERERERETRETRDTRS
jgi:hypothetical protein